MVLVESHLSNDLILAGFAVAALLEAGLAPSRSHLLRGSHILNLLDMALLQVQILNALSDD